MSSGSPAESSGRDSIWGKSSKIASALTIHRQQTLPELREFNFAPQRVHFFAVLSSRHIKDVQWAYSEKPGKLQRCLGAAYRPISTSACSASASTLAFDVSK